MKSFEEQIAKSQLKYYDRPSVWSATSFTY